MKAIHIDSEAQTITEVEYSGLQDLQRMVGGYIEPSKHWPSGDVCYVNEEGKLKGLTHAFVLTGFADVLVGNGVVVGRESDPASGSADTDPPVITVDELRREIRWGRWA